MYLPIVFKNLISIFFS